MKLDKQVRELSLVLYHDLDTPVSLKCYLLVKNGEWDQLAQCRVDPHNYLDCPSGVEKFRRDYQAVELLRKYPGLPISVNRREAAKQNFYAAESQCCVTNLRMDHHLRNYGLSRSEMRLSTFIDKTKKLISRVLGPLPDFLEGRFGPGATFESRGHRFARSLTIGDKMSDTLYCTDSAVLLLKPLWDSAWGRAVLSDSGHGPQVVRGNRFAAVPKDALKDRGICIEPGANLFLQLGVGRFIRRRLKLYGIDLSNGQSLHNILAMLGSLSGDIATIDLSNASDTVAYLLVKLLLPEDWFQLLDSIRSPLTLVDGRWVLLEKFSSMGNGFTFELETLIFGCLAATFCDGKLGVDVYAYGDDLIVPTKKADGFIKCLEYFGFTPNPRKTFTTSAFRESCGGDFFCGVEVTPYHITEIPDEPAKWIAVANGLWRFGRNSRTHRRSRLRVLGFLPSAIRALRGPVELGDLVIHDHQSAWQTKTRNSIRYVRVWRPVSRRVRLSNYTPAVQMAIALYGSAVGERANLSKTDLALKRGWDSSQPFPFIDPSYLTPRGGVSGYRFGRVAFS